MSALDTQARRGARESILELGCAEGVRNGLVVRNIVKNTTTVIGKRVGFRNDPECGEALLKGTETRGALEILPLVPLILRVLSGPFCFWVSSGLSVRRSPRPFSY
jgi:hypothetical protein